MDGLSLSEIDDGRSGLVVDMCGPSLTPGNHYFQTQSATAPELASPSPEFRATLSKGRLALNVRFSVCQDHIQCSSSVEYGRQIRILIVFV
ncbi:hypothetical protein AVEN_161602-1 [Araneus ventricosus]|uniref:Uncharacterized protein n=1 Tax=Araneus ventricosus TaxID=182803 RepID=A0A4Y2FT72_ARAVE|nr:hypothetical protein AVEN_161602-1 [Araneus ventricosus]